MSERAKEFAIHNTIEDTKRVNQADRERGIKSERKKEIE